MVGSLKRGSGEPRQAFRGHGAGLGKGQQEACSPVQCGEWGKVLYEWKLIVQCFMVERRKL